MPSSNETYINTSDDPSFSAPQPFYSLIYNAEEPIYIGTHQYQIYNQHDPPESLHRVADIYAISHEWILIQSWENSTGLNQTFSQNITTGINVMEGSGTAKSMDLEAIFMDYGINTGHSTIEASSTRSQDITVQVGTNSSIYLYRKRVKYRIVAHFKFSCESLGLFRTVGAWHQGPTPLEAVYEVYVNTRDCLIVSEPISGTSTLSIPHPDGPKPQPMVQQWDECTKKCKEWFFGAGFLSWNKQNQNGMHYG